MMLLICSKYPKDNVDYLVENTNKNFVFKNLLELSQLLAGAGITNEMRPVKQGKEIMDWIKRNPNWVFTYYKYLFAWCSKNVNMQPQTIVKFCNIRRDLLNYTCSYKFSSINKPIADAVFRYKKGYDCEYESNTTLDIETAICQYRKYLKWKFKKDEEENV